MSKTIGRASLEADEEGFAEDSFLIYEKSCGAVVFTLINNEIKYLLIRNLTGIYGFPKGHVEQGETE